MDLNFSVFQEPRGVMRILELVFSISAFATISDYSGYVRFKCVVDGKDNYFTYDYDYPFQLYLSKNLYSGTNCTDTTVSVIGDFSSDAKFFVATGVLAMLCTLGLIVLYTKYDDLYKSNTQVPFFDFFITVIFGVLWLSSSAAWASGLNGLKSATDPDVIQWKGVKAPECDKCPIFTYGFSSLNISVILGFLNFFLWAANLWFVYKETTWFQGAQQQQQEGAKTSGI